MARWQRRRERLRAILEGGVCVHPASVHDPISARIAEELGFEMGMFAGSVASLTVLGNPDLILLTLTEFAGQAHRLNRAAELPVLADADHGYGNALNVMRAVEELEVAGIAGLSIEDTDLPRGFGTGEAPELISVEEGVGKIKAALSARRDPRLVIAGRTSAAGFAGIEEAIARVKAYEDAGADASFLVGVKSREDMEAAAEAVSKPLIVGGVGPGMDDCAWLGALGVRVCLQGHQPFAAAAEAIYATMKALRDGTAPQDLTGIASKQRMAALSRDAQHREWADRFLGDGT